MPSLRATRAVAVLALGLGVASPVAAAARPAPGALPRDASRPDLASTFGSGSFGRWIVDRFGLAANRWDPATRHYAGGYGYLNVGGRVLSTLSPRPAEGPRRRRPV